MPPAPLAPDDPPRPLWVWPGVATVAVQWLAWLVLPRVLPDLAPYGLLAAIAAGLVVVLWWAFLSRAPGLERAGVLVLALLALALTRRLVHESIAGAGMGFLLYLYAVPVLSLALVAGALVARRMAARRRRLVLSAALLLACAGFTLVRTGGVSGDGRSDLHWRWSATPEERLLARQDLAPRAAPRAEPVADAEAAPAWPGFRGARRDGVVHGLHLEGDWNRFPPRELWRRPVGPGWSSFAVAGELVYTQEQRGEDELVSCYRLSSGEPVWTHADAARFSESNAGAGPRATPTLGAGRVYALGATGILNALDARTGELLWTRAAAVEAGVSVPAWGFAGSPLLVEDLVVVALDGRLAAHDAATGAPRWLGPAGEGYSSPHLAALDGGAQILQLSGGHARAFAPRDGAPLWEHAWREASCILQPVLLADGDVLISGASAMGGVGLCRLALARGPLGWTATERWNSRGLKPYFNDLVVSAGHAFGFDGSTLACIDLADGTRRWKGGRYGNGQLLLVADSSQLLVLSEEGELALVEATPESFSERARLSVLSGKTWNHPAVAGDVLLVRNAEEMVALRLAVAR